MHRSTRGSVTAPTACQWSRSKLKTRATIAAVFRLHDSPVELECEHASHIVLPIYGG